MVKQLKNELLNFNTEFKLTDKFGQIRAKYKSFVTTSQKVVKEEIVEERDFNYGDWEKVSIEEAKEADEHSDKSFSVSSSSHSSFDMSMIDDYGKIQIP